MTLVARLCALCAMCILLQMLLEGSEAQSGMGLIGGLLMLHLVISGGCDLVMQLSAQRDLSGIFSVLIK